MTALAAEVGLFAIGLDGNWEVISDACRKSKPNLSLAYIHFVVTPQSVAVLPVCDVVLCLSIYHQWHREFGHEGAQQILRILGTKARKRLFFEPPRSRADMGQSRRPLLTATNAQLSITTTGCWVRCSAMKT